ncbi:ABC transporter permease [Nakamurella endophytica]|uniref:ABC transporter permease n=1 Tax=Nakamurella endophytica TaxID=1748367 RepID=A0A917SY99_9ACTN|nr:ABC transporter permease [Nakamurella endophytica]GGM02317.1 ABC transporter permease [Nakamurella endophytica]
MKALSGRRVLLGAAGPVGALIFSAIVSAIILVLTRHNPFEAFGAMGQAFSRPRVLVGTVNQVSSYYLAAVAVAIGFKMNLLNIGVDGQYRLAAMLSAALAGASFMQGIPSVVRILMTIVAAMLIGAAWAGIAVWLKISRGVSEVISTIMLNAIATAVIAYLLSPGRLAVQQGNNLGTRPITDGGMVPTIPIPKSITPLYTLLLLALLVGVLYAFLLSRTVFGFKIKATGLNPAAAVASGISVKRMAVAGMLLSGAVAGLVGMPELLNGPSHQYSINFPSGFAFTGIAIALLGRNHPVGMAFAALLWSALDSSANALQGVGVPNQLVVIMQGTIVLSVVVAYEIVRRYRVVLEQRDVARALAQSRKEPVAA